MKNKKSVKLPPPITAILEAFFTTLAFTTAHRVIETSEILATSTSSHPIAITLAKLQLNYQAAYGIESAIILLLLAFFYYKIFPATKFTKRLLIYSIVAGLLFSIFMLLGNYFMYQVHFFAGFTQTLITLINFLGYYFLFQNIFIFILTYINSHIEKGNHVKKAQ